MMRSTTLSRLAAAAALALLGSCAHRRGTEGHACEVDRDCRRGYGCLAMGGGEQAPYSICYPLTDGKFVADASRPQIAAH